MTPEPAPNFVVTGMRVGCYPYEALLKGTLECFYESECLNNTALWISSLSPFSWPQPLDKMKPSIFYPNTTIASILDANLIEQMNVRKNFSRYYDFCAPNYCSYIVTNRNNRISLLVMLIGLFGGLTVILRKLAPIPIQLGRFIREKFTKKKPALPKIEVQRSNIGNVYLSILFFLNFIFLEWHILRIRLAIPMKRLLISANLFEVYQLH